MGNSPVYGLSYVVVQTEDVDAWRDYGVNTLGLQPSRLKLPEGSVALRMDDRMARFIIQPGENKVVAVGWDVLGLEQWEELQQRLEKAGIDTKKITGDEAYNRGVQEFIRMTDPSGMVTEFVFKPLVDKIDRFVSPLGVEFVTGDQGMGHVTMMVSNFDETVDFYMETLGFNVRETIDLEIRASFASPNPRQHSVALIDGKGTNEFHHVMIEVTSMDDLGRCLDKVLDGAATLIVGLGRHFNDRMTSFYMKAPNGMGLEYGYAGLRVDSEEWVVYAQGGVGGASIWGHRPLDEKVAGEGFRRVDVELTH